jgi:hypothetical protein
VESAHASPHTDVVIACKKLAPIILSSDQNALFNRLAILLASHRAGNIGFHSDIVSIYDELRRLGIVDDSKCKYLMNFTQDDDK